MVVEERGDLEETNWVLESLVRLSHHKLNQASRKLDTLSVQNNGLIEEVKDMWKHNKLLAKDG